MNTTLLLISVLLGVIALFCARSLVIYTNNRVLDKEERTVLPISLVFFVAFGIGICFALSRRDLDMSNTLPLYAIIGVLALVIGLIMNGAYKVAGRLSIFIGISLGIAIGMTIFYTYFIALGSVIILFFLSYIVTKYIQSVKNNI